MESWFWSALGKPQGRKAALKRWGLSRYHHLGLSGPEQALSRWQDQQMHRLYRDGLLQCIRPSSAQCTQDRELTTLEVWDAGPLWKANWGLWIYSKGWKDAVGGFGVGKWHIRFMFINSIWLLYGELPMWGRGSYSVHCWKGHASNQVQWVSQRPRMFPQKAS